MILGYDGNMNDCPFCKLVNEGFPAHVIYENDEAFVMLDRQSVAFGHSMVIPKKHTPLIYEMEDSEYIKLLRLSKDLANIFQENLNPEAVSYLAYGRDIKHVHLHLIPLEYGDEIVEPKKYMKKLSDEQLERDANKLLSMLPDLYHPLSQ